MKVQARRMLEITTHRILRGHLLYVRRVALIRDEVLMTMSSIDTSIAGTAKETFFEVE